jgi:hypothetical protein
MEPFKTLLSRPQDYNFVALTHPAALPLPLPKATPALLLPP